MPYQFLGLPIDDFGRILSETYANDMKVFNVGLARDFKEATAINENTMVSSELRALREISVKEAWKGLVEKLKRLWAKIKAVFRNAYAKLSVWINRSNKLYVAQNRKAIEKKNCDGCKLPKYRRVDNAALEKIGKNISQLGSWATRALEGNGVVGASFDDNGNFKSYSYSNNDKKAAEGATEYDSYYKAREKEIFAEPSNSTTFGNRSSRET